MAYVFQVESDRGDRGIWGDRGSGLRSRQPPLGHGARRAERCKCSDPLRFVSPMPSKPPTYTLHFDLYKPEPESFAYSNIEKLIYAKWSCYFDYRDSQRSNMQAISRQCTHMLASLSTEKLQEHKDMAEPRLEIALRYVQIRLHHLSYLK